MDFQHFFSQFPLNSAVAQYLSELDLDVLLDNVQLALTPLADVPSYCRGEALRRRAAVRSELSMLDDAFADIERHGVSVGQLRGDLTQARIGLEECMRNDSAWCDAVSSPSANSAALSSPGSMSSFDLDLPPLAARGQHRRSASDSNIPPAYNVMAHPPSVARAASWSSHRRMSSGSGTLRPGWVPPPQHAVHAVNGQYYPSGTVYARVGHASALH
ncbi:hypothetical protein BKA62DRAFT_714297 [Auriculariales sp. MPI-PUGE-AT-0066]|nr:hypothetical protein BKA62DRAFT_714297 [Auriculariales sp. MPI-PUGE-AT-0066]